MFREGHERLGAGVVLRAPDGSQLPLAMMRELAPGTDRHGTEVTIPDEGRWQFRVEAWGDPMAGWQHDAAIKIPLGQDVDLMLAEGALLFDRAAKAAKTPRRERDLLAAVAAALRDGDRSPMSRLTAASSPEVLAAMAAWPLRILTTRTRWYPVIVHRRRALFGSWYEFFPRSEGAELAGQDGPRSGTLKSAAGRLDAIAAMGFDVVYLPPVHPIGTTARKGPNNTLTAGPGDPGSPWAIGSPDGGHDSLHPDLGTMADFDAFVERAGELGLEVALDLALQASPDHPWVIKHPEWFTTRADGSIAYAENPPKRYQDIYPVNFDNDPEGIYAEVLRTVRLWMDHGVRIFRVDNPHTKPLRFWERLLADIGRTDPDVLFLAEAFTRPARLFGLARLGYTQSYSYFTWRTEKAELTEFALMHAERCDEARPNLFVNTPDILHESLQHGGRGMFAIRAALAATMGPTWGVYSGFELYEGEAVKPGSEEYLNSEKYELRPRDFAAAAATGNSLEPYITRLNEIRRAHPALQQLRNIAFHQVNNDQIICYSKTDPATGDTVLMVITLDPWNAQEGTTALDLPALGLNWGAGFTVHDEITGGTWQWGQYNYVRLEPWHHVAHIFRIVR